MAYGQNYFAVPAEEPTEMECRGPYACGNGAYALVPERYWPMTNQRDESS